MDIIGTLQSEWPMIQKIPLSIIIISIAIGTIEWLFLHFIYKNRLTSKTDLLNDSDKEKENLKARIIELEDNQLPIKNIGKSESIKYETTTTNDTNKLKCSERLKGYLVKRKKEEPIDPDKLLEFYRTIMNRYFNSYEHDIKYIFKDHCKPYKSPKEPHELGSIIKQLEDMGE